MSLQKQDLLKYNIHYLRSLGRSIGVKSPTTLSKNCLIKKILEIESGKEKPEFSKLGKPPLKSSDNKNINCFNKQNLLKIKKLCNKLNSEINELLKRI